MGGLETLEAGVLAQAVTAIVPGHRPRGRRAHIHVGAGGIPDPGDAAAGIALGQILVRVQLPGEGPRS